MPADLGQFADVLASTGSVPSESFDGSFANLLGNLPLFAHKHDWLPFASLLGNEPFFVT